jgi:hypothetical protein
MLSDKTTPFMSFAWKISDNPPIYGSCKYLNLFAPELRAMCAYKFVICSKNFR